MNKSKKKDSTENKLNEDKDHALESAVMGDKPTKESENMSLSRESISMSVRLWQKLKF